MSNLPTLWQYSPKPKTLLPSELPQMQSQNKRLSWLAVKLASGLSFIVILWFANLFSNNSYFESLAEIFMGLFYNPLTSLAVFAFLFLFSLLACLPLIAFFSYKFYNDEKKNIKQQTEIIKRQRQEKYSLTADKFYILLPSLYANNKANPESEVFVIGETLDTKNIDALRLTPEGLSIYSGSSSPTFNLHLPQNEAIKLKKILLSLHPDNLLDADKN
jgi:hypothetical protein